MVWLIYFDEDLIRDRSFIHCCISELMPTYSVAKQDKTANMIVRYQNNEARQTCSFEQSATGLVCSTFSLPVPCVL